MYNKQGLIHILADNSLPYEIVLIIILRLRMLPHLLI